MADKSVNRSKYNSKKKYSGNKPRAKENAAARASQIAQVEKEKQKSKLGDNWSRYNESDNPAEVTDYKDSTKDYSHLSKAPISKAEYFQFKREQDIFQDAAKDAVKSNSNLDELFKLDLKLISCSLAAIPFHERCDLNEDFFMEEELDKFNKAADNNLIKYDQYINQQSKESI